MIYKTLFSSYSPRHTSYSNQRPSIERTVGPFPMHPARTVNFVRRDTWQPRLPSTTLGSTLDRELYSWLHLDAACIKSVSWYGLAKRKDWISTSMIGIRPRTYAPEWDDARWTKQTAVHGTYWMGHNESKTVLRTEKLQTGPYTLFVYATLWKPWFDLTRALCHTFSRELKIVMNSLTMSNCLPCSDH